MKKCILIRLSSIVLVLTLLIPNLLTSFATNESNNYRTAADLDFGTDNSTEISSTIKVETENIPINKNTFSDKDSSNLSQVTYYTITASAGEGGSITPGGETQVQKGKNQQYTISANNGYKISDVLIDGTSIGAEKTYNFENITANHTISAQFTKSEEFVITASAGEGGSISPSGAVTVKKDGSQTFSIKSNIGYKVKDVLVDGTSIGVKDTYTFNSINTNHTIAASFEKIAPDPVKDNGWKQSSNGKWQYFVDGIAVTGWKNDIPGWNNWFYFDTNGYMATGWQDNTSGWNGQWFYFNDNGTMSVGWQNNLLGWADKWFYFNENGVMQTGWINLDTWYCLADNGVMYADTTTPDGYKVDVNGRWIKDQSLEQAKAVLDIIGWDLHNAYSWAVSFPYYKDVGAVPEQMQHSQYYASYGFSYSMGNCYVKAATFYKMALLLGYEAYFIEGFVPLQSGGMGVHGWCEIVINGTTYVCDPDFDYEMGLNGYMVTYGQSGTWKYCDYTRVD